MPRNSSQLRRDPRSEALLWLALAEIRRGAEKERLAQKYGTEQKKKRIVVGFFFQFRDDCESKRALSNFFLPATFFFSTRDEICSEFFFASFEFLSREEISSLLSGHDVDLGT